MATTLNAGTTTATALNITTDTTGAMNIQTSGTTAIAISSAQVVSLTNPLLPASGGTGVTTSTGSGSNVLSTTPTLTSPTLVAPVLGTPASGNLTNCTFPTLNQNTTGSAGSVTNALTVGTGLRLSSGTTYNGSAAVTVNAIGTTLNSQTGAYVLVAGDAGKMVSITTGGVTVNNSVMSAGDIVTIYNNSASSQTITQGTGVTLQWAGQPTSSTGNRTLGLYGIATIVFLSASSAVITGAGLS